MFDCSQQTAILTGRIELNLHNNYSQITMLEIDTLISLVQGPAITGAHLASTVDPLILSNIDPA